MHVSECQPTIKEVIHDMSRGKPFPTCTSAQNIAIKVSRKQTKTYADYSWSPKSICPDGETRAHIKHIKDSGYRFTCKYLDVTLPNDIAADKEHQKHKYYYH